MPRELTFTLSSIISSSYPTAVALQPHVILFFIAIHWLFVFIKIDERRLEQSRFARYFTKNIAVIRAKWSKTGN